MAINRQDYQYIRNTIPGQQNKMSDGSLGLGVRVNNLVLELKEKNIYNPDYTDYYQIPSDRSVWLTSTSADGKRTVEKKYSITKDTEGVNVTPKIEWKKFTSINSPNGGISGTYFYNFTVNIGTDWDEDSFTYSFIPDNIITGEKLVNYNINTGIVSVYVETNSSTDLKCILSVSKTIGYEVTWEIDKADLVSDLKENEKINNIKLITEGVQMTTSADIIKITFASNTENFSEIELDFEVEVITIKTESFEKTLKEGLLTYSTELDANSTYVLQIINASCPKNKTLPKNKIIFGTSTDNNYIEFGQYLFFTTGATKTKCTLEIYGLSFSYKVLGLNNNSPIQLRTFSSPVEAKVYLFKTTMPWIVNSEGFVVGLNNTTLIAPSVEDIPLNTTFSLNEAKVLFSQKPKITLDEDNSTLQVWLPDGQEDTTWKHYLNWSVFGDKDKIKLVAFRDSLIDSNREYKRGTKYNKTMRRSAIRTIQKTRKSKNDSYANPTNGVAYDIQIEIPTLSINSNTINSIDFKWENNSVRELEKKSTNTNAEYLVGTYGLDLFALLGYNREYCHANNLLFNSGDYQQLAYKYTSICFAWCVVEDRIITRISEYSDPILIDRQAISLYKDSSNKYQLESNECSLSYGSVDNYYPSSIIHLTAN